MAKRVTAAHAKANLSALASAAAFGNERIIIERRGKPLAALVSVSDLERLEAGASSTPGPRGALALVGAWREVEDEDMDSLVEGIYAGREKDTGRSVHLF